MSYDRMNADDASLFDKLSDELIRYAAMLVGPSGAEDVLVNGALRAFAAPGWPTVDNRRAYLYRAVYAEALNERRAAQRRLNRELRAASAAPTSVHPDELSVDLLDALRRLTVRQRAVVFLTYWDDLPPGEIARTLGTSVRTVERELTRSRHRLEVLLR